jgi:hypothetical protein
VLPRTRRSLDYNVHTLFLRICERPAFDALCTCIDVERTAQHTPSSASLPDHGLAAGELANSGTSATTGGYSKRGTIAASQSCEYSSTVPSPAICTAYSSPSRAQLDTVCRALPRAGPSCWRLEGAPARKAAVVVPPCRRPICIQARILDRRACRWVVFRRRRRAALHSCCCWPPFSRARSLARTSAQRAHALPCAPRLATHQTVLAPLLIYPTQCATAVSCSPEARRTPPWAD